MLNVTYPLLDDEIVRFCTGKSAVLIVEEGQPEFIEQNLHMILRKADLPTKVVGKELLPRAGEYTGQVLERGVEAFLRITRAGHARCARAGRRPRAEARARRRASRPRRFRRFSGILPIRPAGFCTGCPERPIFTAMKLLQRELGPLHISCDIGCHLFSILPPFNLGNTTMGYGLGAAGAAAFNAPRGKRAIAVMGDGGFWHNGLTSGVGNCGVQSDGQRPASSSTTAMRRPPAGRTFCPRARTTARKSTKHPIAAAVQGVGVKWLRLIDRTYDLKRMLRYAARGDDDARKGTEGHRGRIRVHAQPAAARAAAAESRDRGRRARGARALRRRCRHLHRRSLLHPPVRLSRR